MAISSISGDEQKMMAAMQRIESQLAGTQQSSGAEKDNSFSEFLMHEIGSVNKTQMDSESLKNSFDMGENVSLAEMMIANQKATVSFQSLLQVRNKLINAYKDIMNLPI